MTIGRKTGGRSRGTPNKFTTELKEMIEGALSDLGGRKWLAKAGKENPAAFLALLAKLIPRDLHLSGEVRHTLEDIIAGSLQPQTDERDSAPSDRPH